MTWTKAQSGAGGLRRHCRVVWRCVLVVAMLTGLTRADSGPWPTPVEGWAAPEPGEHPRLFFRKGDVPALRERAKTPEGQAILTRLRATLGGGEAMPTVYNAATKAYDDEVTKAQGPLPEGAYTISHAAGFGFLFQLTGETRYADLARQCVEKGYDGVRDRDDRYAWVNPGGFLRCGPSLAAYAIAYDLCYDAWDPAFRRDFVERLMTYRFDTKRDGGGTMSLERMALSPRLGPHSNHWGAQVGGVGMTLLAIRGDDGADHAKVDKWLDGVEKNAIRAMTQGFGDGGYFAEHAGPSHVAANTALVPFFQAARVAWGKDFITPRPHVKWLPLRYVHEIVPRDGRPFHPLRHEGSYGWQDIFKKDGSGGMSGGGWFSQGFGLLNDDEKAAMRWVWDQWCDDANEHRYDTVNYPHRAMLAFLNWPIGIDAKNPADVLPRARADTIHGYYVFRNRWQDAHDCVVTVLLGARNDGPEPVMVWGLGLRTQLPIGLTKNTTVAYRFEDDGSGVVSFRPRGAAKTSPPNAVLVDYSGRSGAPCLVAFGGPWRGNIADKTDTARDGHTAALRIVEAGEHKMMILTLQHGEPPPLRVEGDTVYVGGASLRYDGQTLVRE